ncbi:MAG: hypothetical protein ACI3ZS_01360 [Candidatus Cryptobacteroides sp.]
MVRKGLIKVSAFLLVLWYCFSVIGFDVHTCAVSDSQFVSTFIEGFDCEDIHPGHECSHCCDHHDAGCQDCHKSHPGNHSDGTYSENDCCSNHYHVLWITGSRSDDDHRHYDECHCGHCPCIEATASVVSPVFMPQFSFSFIDSAGLIVPSRDVLSVSGVWRV